MCPLSSPGFHFGHPGSDRVAVSGPRRDSSLAWVTFDPPVHWASSAAQANRRTLKDSTLIAAPSHRLLLITIGAFRLSYPSPAPPRPDGIVPQQDRRREHLRTVSAVRRVKSGGEKQWQGGPPHCRYGLLEDAGLRTGHVPRRAAPVPARVSGCRRTSALLCADLTSCRRLLGNRSMGRADRGEGRS